MMKLLIPLSFLLILLSACSADNIDQEHFNVIEEDPVLITIDNPLTFRLDEQDPTITSGTAYEFIGQDANFYLVASDDVQVECPGGLATSFEGPGEFFRFFFFETNDITQVIDGNFNTVVNGAPKTVTTLVPPNCIQDFVQVDYTIEGDRMTGSFTGEYFYLNDEFVEPFDSCVNFISAGILTATFDCPLVNCND